MDYAGKGFSKDPFGVEFDPDFVYQGKSWTAVYHNLAFEIQANREVILLTGEQGVGKSWLIKALEIGLASQAKFVYQKAGAIDYQDFIRKLCGRLELQITETAFSQQLQRLNEYLSARQRPHIVLVIEDAHRLSPAVLAKVATVPMPVIQQALSFQIVLSGHPVLRTRYRRIETETPYTSSSASVTLEGLEQAECVSYILRRLRIAGKDARGLFPQETLDEIWRVSRGIPGHINQVCATALQNAIESGQETVRPPMVPRILNGRNDPKNNVFPTPIAYDIASPTEPFLRESHRETGSRGSFSTRVLRHPGVRISLLGAALFPLLSLRMHPIGNEQTPPAASMIHVDGSRQERSPENGRPDFLLTGFYPQEWITPVSGFRDNAHRQITAEPRGTDREPASELGSKALPQTAFPKSGMERPVRMWKEESEEKLDPEKIYQAARSLGERKLDADAYLLYFRAARLGHLDAAYMLGRMNDPTVPRNRPNSLGDPDTIQAYKWYKKAAKAGHTEAQTALVRLRAEINGLASAGDVMAQRWRLQWD